MAAQRTYLAVSTQVYKAGHFKNSCGKCRQSPYKIIISSFSLLFFGCTFRHKWVSEKKEGFISEIHNQKGWGDEA